MRLLSLTAPALLLVLLVGTAGCGSDADSESGSGSESGSVQARTELEITFWPQGRGKGGGQKLTLSCDPPAGTHPNPAEACEKLAALNDPFAPLPKDQMCIQLYGGPEEALISGTYRGKRVSYALSRTDGCKIDRYEKLSFLLPPGSSRA